MKFWQAFALSIFMMTTATLSAVAQDNPISPEGYLVASLLILILLQISSNHE